MKNADHQKCTSEIRFRLSSQQMRIFLHQTRYGHSHNVYGACEIERIAAGTPRQLLEREVDFGGRLAPGVTCQRHEGMNPPWPTLDQNYEKLSEAPDERSYMALINIITFRKNQVATKKLTPYFSVMYNSQIPGFLVPPVPHLL